MRLQGLLWRALPCYASNTELPSNLPCLPGGSGACLTTAAHRPLAPPHQHKCRLSAVSGTKTQHYNVMAAVASNRTEAILAAKRL